jgi:YfiH family protein
MLEKRISPQGPVYYISPVIEKVGVPHAFTTRIGGISQPPFDSLNLGNPSGCDVQDDYERIYENFRLMQRAIGCDKRERLWVHQVHGGCAECAMRGGDFESGRRADAMVSDDPAKVLAVRVADCVPVLIATSDGKTVAAIHAGWRGVIANVVPNAIAKMGQTDSLLAAIGPGIGFDAFEVGLEVVEQFELAFANPELVRRLADDKGRVDLRRAIELQLSRCGLSPGRIDTTDRCTFRDRDEFFSHRRDKGVTGRMAALIGSRER